MGHLLQPRCPVCSKQAKRISPSSFISRQKVNSVLYRLFYLRLQCPACKICFSYPKIGLFLQRVFLGTEIEGTPTTRLVEIGKQEQSEHQKGKDLTPAALERREAASENQSSNSLENSNSSSSPEKLSFTVESDDWQFSCKLTPPGATERKIPQKTNSDVRTRSSGRKFSPQLNFKDISESRRRASSKRK